jgi:hypothetical protein
MTRVLLTLVLLPAAAFAQVTLPPGTQLPVSIPQHLPMKAGEPIRAELLYPVYADNQLILPAKTIVTGTVVSLSPNHHKRLNARLRADFTPFHIPVVRFDAIVAPDGSATPIATSTATDGAPIYRVVRTPAPKGGIVGQYFHILLQYGDDTIQTFIGPNKGDRLLQFIYGQLPYHPERIAKGTAWTVETAAPVAIAPLPPPPPVPEPEPSRFRLIRTKSPAYVPPPPAPGERPTWILQAYLNDAISSETSKTGQAIHATVAEPVLNADSTVAVPQGAILTGTVTQARPARKFARAGLLRFNFSEIKLPGQDTQTVRTSLAGADSSGGQQLDMNSEGDVKPKPQDKILIPALLIILASQPFDRGHHGDGDGMGGKDAEASGSLGLLSLIIGTAARQPNFAIGLGFYSAALSIYPRYFARGAKVAFPKDTRIVIQTTGSRSSALRPTTQPQP